VVLTDLILTVAPVGSSDALAGNGEGDRLFRLWVDAYLAGQLSAELQRGLESRSCAQASELPHG
jgi:hypothetical protein